MIVKRKWLDSESYVEVCYTPHWADDDFGKLDVYWFKIDPRKAQYHKPKFWSRNHSHGVVEPDFNVDPIVLSNNLFGFNGRYRQVSLAAREIFKELRRTSSVRRAAA